GIVGNLASGKSALVHRYLTGTYVQEESPEGTDLSERGPPLSLLIEMSSPGQSPVLAPAASLPAHLYAGGRFKKEIVVDGQSYLLLIRDEGGPPEAQFAMWVDAVIFVFSLEDEISFQTVYHYYSRMASYRSTSEIPLVLVGTQDAISSTNPRVIDDSRARKLSSDLKRCTYYETCATYGLNVERVFQDGAAVNILESTFSGSHSLLPGDGSPGHGPPILGVEQERSCDLPKVMRYLPKVTQYIRSLS
ncbi:Arf-GAP with GTPase, ANK repeat and PH domain-containing protein 1, partial [Myotis davidii]